MSWYYLLSYVSEERHESSRIERGYYFTFSASLCPFCFFCQTGTIDLDTITYAGVFMLISRNFMLISVVEMEE